MIDIPSEIKNVQVRVDSFLQSYLSAKEQTVLVREIARMVGSGGKRLRPFIMYKTYQLLGGKDDVMAIKFGAAIELFHTFALIHDDIIDRSDLRRSVPTTRKKMGDPAAILVGDLSLVFAHDIFNNALLDSNLSDNIKISLQREWCYMQEEVLTGEYLDSNYTIFNVIQEKEVDFEKLRSQSMKVMELKTARYTIVHPLLFAGLLLGKKTDLSKKLSDYGTKLGIAFQIKDDLLGIFGDEKTIGKPIDSDVKEGKITLLMIELLSKLPRSEWTNENVRNITFVRERMKAFGIVDVFQNKINNLTEQALTSVEVFGEKKMRFFRQFSNFIISRNN